MSKIPQKTINLVSRGHKFYYMLLNELGYKDVEVEKNIGLLCADLYIKDIDMII